MVEDLLKFNADQLLHDDIIDVVKKEIDRIIRQFDVKGATQLSRFLGLKISENSSLSEIYRDIIAQADFIRIGLLDENQTLALIKNYFGLAFSFPLDILTPMDIIKRKLISTSLIDQELLRERINKALKENSNILTTKELILTSRNEKVKPTIGSWLLDYDLRLAEGKDRSLFRVEYLTNSSNIVNLSEEEKEKIKQLIKVYDFVNTSSLIPSASPEDLIVTWENGCRFIMSEGETEVSLLPIKDSVNSLKEPESEENNLTNLNNQLNHISNQPKSFEEKYEEEESSGMEEK